MIVVGNEYKGTRYGLKKEGESRFVIIAPHASGDDLKTGTIAKRLARKLSAFLVINNKYYKPQNVKAKINTDFVEDFNKLTWSNKHNKYLWKKKKRAMKLFFRDIAAFCDQAQIYSKENKAVAVYIHGMKEEKIGIDIGAGIHTWRNKNKLLQHRKYRDNNNSGLITVKMGQLKQFKKLLEEGLKSKFNLPVNIGYKYIGWSKSSAHQFHNHGNRNDYALQIEINNLLREKENRRFLTNLINRSLKRVFI
ncbi:MAG: hypothetical protein NTZ49_02175 [Candidatus Parcubacteria bacterium]|nr:hypothetical protein [Candidatus Parcubacteria bacterium]